MPSASDLLSSTADAARLRRPGGLEEAPLRHLRGLIEQSEKRLAGAQADLHPDAVNAVFTELGFSEGRLAALAALRNFGVEAQDVQTAMFVAPITGRGVKRRVEALVTAMTLTLPLSTQPLVGSEQWADDQRRFGIDIDAVKTAWKEGFESLQAEFEAHRLALIDHFSDLLQLQLPPWKLRRAVLQATLPALPAPVVALGEFEKGDVFENNRRHGASKGMRHRELQHRAEKARATLSVSQVVARQQQQLLHDLTLVANHRTTFLESLANQPRFADAIALVDDGTLPPLPLADTVEMVLLYQQFVGVDDSTNSFGSPLSEVIDDAEMLSDIATFVHTGTLSSPCNEVGPPR